MKQIDAAICFGIYKVDDKLFVHGEFNASRIDKDGTILRSLGFADILLTIGGNNYLVIHENFIEVKDFRHNKYKIRFDGDLL